MQTPAFCACISMCACVCRYMYVHWGCLGSATKPRIQSLCTKSKLINTYSCLSMLGTLGNNLPPHYMEEREFGREHSFQESPLIPQYHLQIIIGNENH